MELQCFQDIEISTVGEDFKMKYGHSDSKVIKCSMATVAQK